MRKTFIAFALVAGAFALPAPAEVLELPPAPAARVATPGPQRGASMAEVKRQFGEPSVKHAPVGGGQKLQPPITRWDYPDFTVVFERTKVIDVVIKGAPMPVQNPDALPAPSP